MKYELDGLPIDLHFPSNVDPEEWRSQPDPDGDDDEGLDDDQDLPAQSYIISALGFNPDEETPPYQRRVENNYTEEEEDSLIENFNPSQPRDSDGKWSSGGGGKVSTKEKPKERKFGFDSKGDPLPKDTFFISENGCEVVLTNEAYGKLEGQDDLSLKFNVYAAGNTIFGTNKDSNEVIIEKCIKACGIPGGSKVEIEPLHNRWNPKETPKALEVRYTHPDADIEGLRTLKKGEIINEFFIIKNKELRGSGLGTSIFIDQVEGAHSLGMSKISTLAAGEPGDKLFNGYYTWPRLGYDGHLPKEAVSKLPNSGPLSKATKVSDLMKSSEGRDWWKSNGSEVYLNFDLNPESLSRKVLDSYAKEKNIR